MRLTRLCLVPTVMLVLGTVVAHVAHAAPPEKELQGKWETTDPDSQNKVILDFVDKNTVKISVGSVILEAKYKFIDDENLEMTMTFGDVTMTEKVKFKLGGNELVITGKDNKPTKFTRPAK